MKRIFFVSILLALALGACSPVATGTIVPSAAPNTAQPSPLPASATPPATKAPSSSPEATQKAPPTPTITLNPTTAASPTAAPTDLYTQTAPDCAAFPGFPACGASLPLSGKLAVFDAASQAITVLDFKAKLAWKIMTAPQIQRLEWLGGGNFLLTYKMDVPSLAWANPANPGSFHLPQLSPQGTRLFSAADGSKAWMEMKDLQFLFHTRLGKSGPEQVWPAGAPGDKIHEILGWVPGAPLLLAGYHFSGNSMWVNGDRLYTLNPANGTIKEINANLRLNGPFQWHPSQTGLMVMGDSNQATVMGAPRLAVLDVIAGKVTHLIADETVSSSYPSWTADGKGILHAASKVGSPVTAVDPFALPAVYLTQWPDGATRRLTNPPAGVHDDWPQMLPDGSHFLYLRVPDGGTPVELRMGTLDGSQDALVAGGLSPVSTQPLGPRWDMFVAYAP